MLKTSIKHHHGVDQERWQHHQPHRCRGHTQHFLAFQVYKRVRTSEEVQLQSRPLFNAIRFSLGKECTTALAQVQMVSTMDWDNFFLSTDWYADRQYAYFWKWMPWSSETSSNGTTSAFADWFKFNWWSCDLVRVYLSLKKMKIYSSYQSWNREIKSRWNFCWFLQACLSNSYFQAIMVNRYPPLLLDYW